MCGVITCWFAGLLLLWDCLSAGFCDGWIVVGAWVMGFEGHMGWSMTVELSNGFGVSRVRLEGLVELRIGAPAWSARWSNGRGAR